MSVFAARLTPGSSDWLHALGDGRYGNECRQQQQQQQQQPVTHTASPRHVRATAFADTEFSAVSVKPDPDNAFPHITRSPHVDESSFATASMVYNHQQQHPSWLSPCSRSFHEDSRRQTPRLIDTSMSWPVGRQRFLDTTVAAGATREETSSYAASRLPHPGKDEYTQRRGGSPGGEDSGQEPWGLEDDQSCRSPPPPVLTSVNDDPYRTVPAPGHRRTAAAELERRDYRSGADENGADEGILYRPRKLLADLYRYGERRDRQNQHRQEAREEVDQVRLSDESRRWEKAASAYDGSPPAEQAASSEANNFFHGRRQTWPFGTSVVPAVRRRQPPHQTSDQYVDYMEEDLDGVDRFAAASQQSAVVAAAAAAAAAAASSPMSRLIQRYDHHSAMTASTTGEAAFPVAVSAPHHVTSGGRGEWYSLSWQPPVTSASTIDSFSSSAENLASISLEHADGNKTYSCHICSYIGDSKLEFDAHMRLHFDHRCPFCDYSSRTEGRLRCHIKTFHADGGLCSGAPVTDQASKRKPKIITCQKCGFKAKEKEELWIHRRHQHMSADKVLECPRCPFATELRHHLEYHLRSHYGSRPYKCDKCTYRCYNQSMLNSHAKSHTNVYQFRCADCQFAAKYCHSLKVHLRQNPTHTAAPVLNEDGSVPMDGSGDFEVISRRGRPRGPRAQRRITRPRISRPGIAPLLPKPSPPPPALPLSMPSGAANPVSSVPHQYAENVRGPPVMSNFPVVNDETRRADSGMFPLLPPTFAAAAADFAAANHGSRHGDPFQTESSSGFHMMTADDAGRKDDRTAAAFSSSPSLFLAGRLEASEERVDDRRCRSYSPSMFGQHLQALPAAASAQSHQLSALAPAKAAYDDYAVAAVSPPMPEPERALCGDLPLDLTAKSSGANDPPTSIEPETGSTCSPDDVTAYRPRRHYETWKLQGARPRFGDASGSERKDDDASAAGDVKPEVVGVACAQPEPEMDVDGGAVGEPLTETTAAPPAKRGRASTDDAGPVSEVATGSPTGGADGGVGAGRYQCCHCEIEFFGSRVLHAMHMAFHGAVDPFQCSQCGVRTADRVEFFLHLARAAHS